MTSTVLTLVQDFCDRNALPRPTAMFGSTEKGVRQYQAVLKQVVRDLSEYRWQQQRIYITWPTVAGQDQGTLESIFGAGYAGIVQDSMWNLTRHMRIYGPLSEQVWTALQTLPNAGPEFQMWISRDRLYTSPAQVIGETLACVYITNYNVVQNTGSGYNVYVASPATDGDKLLFPDNVVDKCFTYIWKKQKGESSWTDDYNDYIALVAKNIIKDGATKLQMSPAPNRGVSPGIVIPPGSWNV